MLSESQKNYPKLLTNKSLVTVRTDFLILEGKELNVLNGHDCRAKYEKMYLPAKGQGNILYKVHIM